MYALNLFVHKKQNLINLLEFIESFGNSINMRYDVDKRAVIHEKCRRMVEFEEIQLRFQWPKTQTYHRR